LEIYERFVKKILFLKAIVLLLCSHAYTFASMERVDISQAKEEAPLAKKSLIFLRVSSPEKEHNLTHMEFLPKRFPNFEIPPNVDANEKQKNKEKLLEVSLIDLLKKTGITPENPEALKTYFIKKLLDDLQGPISKVGFSWLIEEELQDNPLDFSHRFYQKRQSKGPLTPTEQYLYTCMKNPTLTHTDAIVIAAGFIEEMIQQKGPGTVLFPGRSSNLIQKAFESLQEHKGTPATPCYQINFSGSPDSCLPKSGNSLHDRPELILKNSVNKDRLTCFMDYCNEVGLHKTTDKLYIVDLVGQGGSLNSLIRVLKYYFEIHLKRTLPDIELFDFGGSSYEGSIFNYDEQEERLTYEEDTRLFGAMPFSINVTGIPFPYHLSRLLDYDPFQFFLAHGVYFPAVDWNKGFMSLFKTGGPWHKDFYKDLLPELEKTVKMHQKTKPLTKNKEESI
jgi:hypothetical protein